MASPTIFNPRFPNIVARDTNLSPAGLVTIAYRSTFVGEFKLIPDQLGHLVSKGLGKNAATAAVAQIKALAYIRRWQPPGTPGNFSKIEEVLCLPKCGRSGRAGRYVGRAWFNGTLDVKQLAALLYLRAGTGKGPSYCRELQSRFGWSRPTASKVIRALIARGLLDKTVSRYADQTFRATTYAVPRLAAGELARSASVSRSGRHADTANSSTVKKPANGLPGNGSPGNGFSGNHTYSSSTPYKLPSGESPDALKEGKYAFRAAREKVPTISDLDQLHHLASADQSLLGWTSDAAMEETVFDGGPYDSDLEQVVAAASEADLRDRLRKATDGRIAKQIIAPAGLYAVRWLAASVVTHAEEEEDDDAVSPAKALGMLLDAIWTRIGSQQGQWLNSLALIGRRLAAERYRGWTGEDMYGPRPPVEATALAPLYEADGARTLAPNLRGNPAGYSAFLDQQAKVHQAYPHEIELIIIGILRRHMIDDKPVWSIKTWRYFEDAIAEELHMQRVANGTRPGDVFGAHRWKETTNA